MALETGTVYEAERAGSSLGLFTVSSALHSNAANLISPWIGTGKWVPNGSDTTSKALKAESVPAGIDKGEGPPRLTRDPTKVSQPSSAPPTAPQSQTTAPSDSGDEPPRLTKGTPPPASAPPTSSTPSGQSQPNSGSTAPSAPAPPSLRTPNRPMPRRTIARPACVRQRSRCSQPADAAAREARRTVAGGRSSRIQQGGESWASASLRWSRLPRMRQNLLSPQPTARRSIWFPRSPMRPGPIRVRSHSSGLRTKKETAGSRWLRWPRNRCALTWRRRPRQGSPRSPRDPGCARALRRDEDERSDPRERADEGVRFVDQQPARHGAQRRSAHATAARRCSRSPRSMPRCSIRSCWWRIQTSTTTCTKSIRE